jgi:hypothetical protein
MVSVAHAAPSPKVVLDSTPPADTNQTSATFQFHASGATGSPSFQCSLDGGTPSACTSPQTYTGLPEGPDTFSVQLVATAATTPTTYAWTIDLTPPTTQVTEQPPPLSNSSTAAFAFDSPDTTATFLCSLNGAAAQPCTSPLVYSGLADATRTLLIQAVDPAGNHDTQAQPITWTVDTTPPDTTLLHPGNIVAKTEPGFTFTSSETGSTFQCSFDGQPFTTCASPHIVDVTHSGPHTFRVRAVDGAGNDDPTPAAYAWTSDLTPPKRPRVTIFAMPVATGSRASPVTGVSPKSGLGLTFTSPLAGLLSTPTFTLERRLQAQWSSDASAVSYDVTVETLPEDSTGQDEHGDNVLERTQYSRTKRRALRLSPYFGETVCLEVTARDKVGNVSRATTTCTTIPNSFAPPWGPYNLKRAKDARAWRGYYVVLRAGDALTQPINDDAYFAPSRAELIAERCRGCGTVEFAFTRYPLGARRPHVLATVDLNSSHTRDQMAVIGVKLPRRWLERRGEGLIVLLRTSGEPRLSGVGFTE